MHESVMGVWSHLSFSINLSISRIIFCFSIGLSISRIIFCLSLSINLGIDINLSEVFKIAIALLA